MRIAILTSFVSLALLALPAGADAQGRKRCSDGQASAADCIDGKAASTMRENAVAQTQPRISYTSPPRQPSRDRDIYVQKNFHEMNNIFLVPRTTRNTAVKP